MGARQARVLIAVVVVVALAARTGTELTAQQARTVRARGLAAVVAVEELMGHRPLERLRLDRAETTLRAQVVVLAELLR